MKKAEDLFAAWETPMVRACLQGHMGRVHAQGEDSALASIGDFCFLAGEPSPELLELAEKVRTLLSACDPADPAVAALKQSPAYQKVAHLIEGSEVPVAGGLLQ